MILLSTESKVVHYIQLSLKLTKFGLVLYMRDFSDSHDLKLYRAPSSFNHLAPARFIRSLIMGNGESFLKTTLETLAPIRLHYLFIYSSMTSISSTSSWNFLFRNGLNVSSIKLTVRCMGSKEARTRASWNVHAVSRHKAAIDRIIIAIDRYGHLHSVTSILAEVQSQSSSKRLIGGFDEGPHTMYTTHGRLLSDGRPVANYACI